MILRSQTSEIRVDKQTDKETKRQTNKQTDNANYYVDNSLILKCEVFYKGKVCKLSFTDLPFLQKKMGRKK